MEYDVIQIGDVKIGPDELVDAEIASRIVGLSVRTIRNLAYKRAIPIYKIRNNRIKYLVRDLLEWSEQYRIDN